MENIPKELSQVADRLADLYLQSFGGKEKGRYRISEKLVRKLADRRRLYERDIRALTYLMYEKGYVFIDMDSFFVVLSANTFVNYRRVNEDSLT
ncbi:hypothetical protein [Sneathiella sp.]|jgi:hypothetical protein|uniref:hypothetical protein n=1 Tax=Sneathiella sp. TaxID=1964365 RepID=UPI0039E70622